MTTQILNNFVRGKLDGDLSGRFDLPIFTNGFLACSNFISNYKGNLKYRTGFLYEAETRNNERCRLIQFRFNTNQTYVIEFTNNYARFYTYDNNGVFGYVTDDSGKVLVLNTGISSNYIQALQVTQNADVMYITASGIQPRKLKRTSATSFTIENVIPSGIDWTTVGYPSSCTFYKGRLWFGGFSKKPTTIKASKVADYENFTIPTSNITDDDALSLTLTDIADPILWIRGGKNNLLLGNTEGVCVVNGGTTDEAITSTKVNADLANRNGASAVVPIEKDSKMLYVSTDKNKCFSFDYDYVNESFTSENLNIISSEVGYIAELYYKKDKNDLIYCRTEDEQLLTLLYNKDENIIGWFPLKTNGKVKSICVTTRPDGKDDVIACIYRNGIYYIERLAQENEFTDYYDTDYINDSDKKKFNQIQLEEAKDCIYLDCSVVTKDLHNEKITVSGDRVVCDSPVFKESHIGKSIVYKTETGAEVCELKIVDFISNTEVGIEILTENVYPLVWNQWYLTFNVIGGLEDVEGIYQSVVADGGYIGEFLVQDGKITLDKNYSVIVVGYKYTAIAKTFNLGSYADGRNGQTMKKRINEFVVRFVNSAGFKIGTSLDNLQSVQLFDPNGYYDTIPLLMNGDEFIYGYNDLHKKEKYIYMVQDEPLPANVTAVEYKIQYEALE